MIHDKRAITNILDDGSPFVIWEREQKGPYKRGIILDTSVCDNPDCRYLHLQAVAVDERFKNMKFKGRKFAYTVESDIDPKSEPLPNQTLAASINIDSAKVSVHKETPLEKQDQDLLDWLKREVTGRHFELMQRRWRAAKKVGRDRWRKMDWSWWEPGLVVGWEEVFPDDPDFLFDLSETRYWARDLYCINPGCTCNEIKVSFVAFDQGNNPKELGAVGIDFKKFRIEGIEPVGASEKELAQIWQQFQKQAGVKQILKTRQKEMKIIGPEIAKLSRKNKSKGPKSVSKAGPKVGRNDPCPCGSGKKYKKCCLNK
jgi:hypothetical protein